MHATLIHEFFLPCIGAPSARSRAAVHAAAVCKQATQREALLPHSQRARVKGGPRARLHSPLAQGRAALSCCLWRRSLAGRHDEGEVCLAHQVLAHVRLGSHLMTRGGGGGRVHGARATVRRGGAASVVLAAGQPAQEWPGRHSSTSPSSACPSSAAQAPARPAAAAHLADAKPLVELGHVAAHHLQRRARPQCARFRNHSFGDKVGIPQVQQLLLSFLPSSRWARHIAQLSDNEA